MAVYTDENFSLWKEAELKNPQQLSLQTVRECSKKASLRKLLVFSIASSRSNKQCHKLSLFTERGKQAKVIETNNKELFASKTEADKRNLAHRIELHFKLAKSITEQRTPILMADLLPSIVDRTDKIYKIVEMVRIYLRQYSTDPKVCHTLFKTNPEFNQFCKMMQTGSKDSLDKTTEELVPLLLATFERTNSVLSSIDRLIQHLAALVDCAQQPTPT